MIARPYRLAEGRLQLEVRLTPKGGRNRIDGLGGLADGRVVVLARVSAPPEKGAANRALERLVADWLEIPPSQVSIVSGATARVKTLAVGTDEPSLIAALERLGPPR